MAEVTIGANTYDVYISVADADIYLGGQVSTAGAAWRAADADTKARGIVSATRLIDRQEWAGTPTEEYLLHAFPRSGLTYCNGSGEAVPDNIVPQEVLDATAELAALMIEGSDVQNAPTTASGVQMLKAGSVTIMFFRGDPTLFARLPLIIQELLGCWLRGFDAITAGTAFGTDRESQFEDEFLFTEGI